MVEKLFSFELTIISFKKFSTKILSTNFLRASFIESVF